MKDEGRFGLLARTKLAAALIFACCTLEACLPPHPVAVHDRASDQVIGYVCYPYDVDRGDLTLANSTNTACQQ